MTYSLIYNKTARGVEEVRARRAGLSAAARRVLILIDGRRSEDELRLVVREGELESALVALRAQGLIEECALTDRPGRGLDDDPPTVPLAPGGLALDLGQPADRAQEPPTLRRAIAEADRRATAAPPPPSPAATIVIRPTRSAPPPAREETNAALEEAKRAAVRALYDRLGPYGEEPAARINECRTQEALREQIRHACRRISTFRGESAARDYLAAIGLS